MTEQKKIRCAIYTRKSTDEGLNVEFNTLEAQREAGENYVKSQAYQGWVAIPERYDDGGYSGGSMDRPALKKLIEDIKRDKVDMIVVYKIDRLTRSLLDFSKLIQILDEHHCSFVSVTQNFNTYDSMGRLTLNILLSFAQFERELDAERIRDKIAASKKKGIWMGGCIPLGYKVENRKLVVEPSEAETVIAIYKQYKVLQSTRKVARYLNQNGYENKSRYSPKLKNKGIRPFSAATVKRILANPIYAGKLAHKNEIYEGQHEAIIPLSEWELIEKIRKNNIEDHVISSSRYPEALLKGLLECGTCHTSIVRVAEKRHNIIYEYYEPFKKKKEGDHSCEIRNIPTKELDEFIIKRIVNIIKSPKVIDALSKLIAYEIPNAGLCEIIKEIENPKEIFQKLPRDTIRHILRSVIKKIYMYPDHLVIHLTAEGSSLLEMSKCAVISGDKYDTEKQEITCNIALTRKQGQVVLVTNNACMDMVLVKAIAQALDWKDAIRLEGYHVDTLAKKANLSRRYVTKMLKLARLSPSIIRTIVKGKQPETLTLTSLLNSQMPVSWKDQEKLYLY